MSKIIANILFGIVWVISLLPMPFLYLFADIIWLLMYICPPLRYRKKIVQNNPNPGDVKKNAVIIQTFIFAANILKKIETAKFLTLN